VSRGASRRRAALLVALALALDVVFVGAVLGSGERWGIWDWDYQCTLLEAARRTILEHGQWPLWNPWLGGGHSLAGHPLGRTANPSFLPVLALGTLPGVKLDVLLYLLLGQVGTARLLRRLGAGWPGACLGALVGSWGGCYAMHLTHGHFEWMAYAWVPWMLASLEAGLGGRAGGALLGAGAFAALTWLDGGPYQLAFVPLFVGLWGLVTALARRSPRPLLLALGAGALGLLLAAIQILPVLEMARAFPRETASVNLYYGAPFEIDTKETLWQMLLSREQGHDPGAWMPFRINVGAYVGWLPLLLALLAPLLRARGAGRYLALLLASLGLALSTTLPVDAWSALHALPGFGSLQIPARFNAFVLLCVAVLAGLGLDALARAGPRRIAAPAAAGLVAVAALDLWAVVAPLFDVAFCVPPVTLERADDDFVHYTRSAYREVYARTATAPIWPNWPNATLPYVRANAGVVVSYLDIPYPRDALPHDHPVYPGAEVFVHEGELRVVASDWTPNAVWVAVDGGGGTVIVNRNAHDGWTLAEASAGVALGVEQGLLALAVPPGRHEATLAFRPPGFALGAALSAAGWLGWIAARARRRRVRGAAGSLALLLLLSGCAEGPDPAPRGAARRVLLVTCDTLRPDRLSLYGYERTTSPRLDAFAREALVFENAWACAPHTSPALSSLMTSRWPDEIGMAGGNRMLMPAQVVTLAERLREAGVGTAAVVGNWTLRAPRPEDGDVGLAQGFALYDDRMGARELNRETWERRAAATTDAALEALAALPAGAPQFLWVHYQDPHGPYTPPPGDAARFARAEPGPRRLPIGRDHGGLAQIPAYQALDGETRVDVYLDRYDAEVHYFDRELGRLLDALAARGALDDALVLFTADHGESLGERDVWFAHETHVFGEQVRVPLVLRPPGGVEDGPRRIATPVSHLDVAPTVLDAFGLDRLAGRGHSLLRPLPDGDERLLVQTLHDPSAPEGWLGLTRGRWRLIVTGREHRLFDLARDPGERHDVAPEHPDVVRALLDAYARRRRRAPAPPVPRGVDRHMDEQTRRALRALGYLGDEDG